MEALFIGDVWVMSLIRCVLLALGIVVSLSWSLAQTACGTTSGEVERNTYYSAVLGETMIYSIYLPPCYPTADYTYPTLYLFHGSNDDDQQWARLGLLEELDAGIQAGRYPPLVVVMPFGDWIANEARFDGFGWADVVERDLFPHIEATYHVATDAPRRAIGGISRGGFWAYAIALRNANRFGKVGGHSAFLEAVGVTPDYDPYQLIRQLDPTTPIQFWLDRGADDYSAPTMDAMPPLMASLGLRHQYTVYDSGQHNNAYWSAHVADYLRFYTEGWASSPTPTRILPSSALFVTATPADTRDTRGLALFVPSVPFIHLRTTIPRDSLKALVNGENDPELLLSAETARMLVAHGARLHPAIRVVAEAELYNRLVADRRLYTILPFDALTPRYRLLWMDDVPIVDQLGDYPLAFASTNPNFRPERLTRITLSGVTALTRQTRDVLDAKGVAWAVEGIYPYVSRSDFFHTSNEVSFHPSCPSAVPMMLGGPTSFCSLPSHFSLFSDLGVDIVELTGNHNNDYGYEAYTETLNFFDTAGIRAVGGGADVASARRPLLLEHHDNHLALVACNAVGPYYALANDAPDLLGGVRPGAAACAGGWLEALLPTLSADNDIVILLIQHQEYEDYIPSPDQRADFRRYADLGADVVIGTAPHKPQIAEFYGDKPAFLHYGLGNLFFDQPFWGNMRFLMDTLYIYEGRFVTLELFPGIIEDLARPRLMTAQERENFLFFLLMEQGNRAR